MDDTQRDGSDSDWDSTLDFTSPRQVGIGHLRPGLNMEVEEESALSDESDIDIADNLPIDKHVIKNVLKPTDERPRAPSPRHKENNIILAQKQQNVHHKQSQRVEQPANRYTQNADPHDPPPYNFREALTDKGRTPEPAERGLPGKDRKGTAYDPVPSPTPRGVMKNQGSVRSTGSWDESDADERTLREVRSNYRQERQREDQKMKEEIIPEDPDINYEAVIEETSIVENPPQTARSETTWRNWTQFGKKNKASKNTSQSQENLQSLEPPMQSARSQLQKTPTSANVPPRVEVSSPSMIEVHDPRYRSPMPSQHHVPYHQYPATPVAMPTVGTIEDKPFEEPRKLFDRDEETGRYVYYFGHGNLHYYEVNDEYEEAALPPIADKVDRVVQRIWQELFAVLRIILSIVIWFIVELFRFIARHIFQPLIVGILVNMGDFVVKPFLSAMFNGFVQPGSVCMWNVCTGMRHMFSPVGEILRSVLEQFAMLFRSMRLFDVTWVTGRDNGAHLQPHVIQNI